MSYAQRHVRRGRPTRFECLCRVVWHKSRADQGQSHTRMDNVFIRQARTDGVIATKSGVSTLTRAAYGSPHAASRDHDANATASLERV